MAYLAEQPVPLMLGLIYIYAYAAGARSRGATHLPYPELVGKLAPGGALQRTPVSDDVTAVCWAMLG